MQPILRAICGTWNEGWYSKQKPEINKFTIAVLVGLTAGIGQAPGASETGWVRQTPLQNVNTLRGVAVLDSNTVVAVGDRGTILRTVNRGETWKAEASGIENTLFAVSFTDLNNGTAIGGFEGGGSGVSGTIVRTTDGGVTWARQTIGTHSVLWGISFSDNETGIAVGDLGTVLRTTNGGVTWQSHDDPDLGGLRAVALTGANGIAVGGGVGIHRTTDGGITWTPKSLVGGAGRRLYGVSFSDANAGTAVGTGGIIMRTADGGVSWKVQSSGTTSDLFGVFFTDANNGTIVGDRGTILRTNNAGVTWKPQSSGSTDPLFGVFFDNAITGWVVGANGLILHTTTGGESGPIAVSSPSLTAPLAPNSLASIVGVDLAAASGSVDNFNFPLPVTLGGVSLRLRDSTGVERLSGLFDVSPSRIRFLVPIGTAVGAATLEVVNAPTTLPPVTVEIANLAPGLFTFERKMAAAYAVRLEPNGTQSILPAPVSIVLDDRPVYLILFGTGIRNRSSLDNVRCTIGGVNVPVEYAGPNGGGVPGIDQVNVRLTNALRGKPGGPLVLTVDGIPANTVLVDVH